MKSETFNKVAWCALGVILIANMGGGSPSPAPSPTPAGIAQECREAMHSYVIGMASDFDALAVEVKAGKHKTVLNASAAANAKDVATRSAFKQALGVSMGKRLGDDVLPADASETLSEIAKGFREASK